MIALDTNILVDLTLAERKEEEHISPRLKRALSIAELYLTDKIDLVISDRTLLEYRSVLQELFLELKLFDLGFHTREFLEAKRNIRLSEDELKGIENIIGDLKEIASKKTHELDTEFITNLAKKGVEFIDAILIFQVIKSGCRYFVTRDDALYNKIKNLDLGIEIIKPEQFLKLQESKRNKYK